MEFLKEHAVLIGIITMPLTYGFIGWVTNWVALKMTFYPLVFWGIPPYIGWQGIIPRRSLKMADKAVNIITERLVKMEEIFTNLDYHQIEKELHPVATQMVTERIQTIANSISPAIWDFLPDAVKTEIVNAAQAQTPEAIKEVMDDMRANIYEIFDVKALVMEKLTGPNVERMVDMFKQVGGPEFRFIELSGLYFGFLLGLVQVGIWSLYPALWTLPIQGILVGYLTNYLALQMIFRPQTPKGFGRFKYQGLFHKRQAEVSREYAVFVATYILTPRNIMDYIFYGRAAEKINFKIRAVTASMIEKFAGMAISVVSVAVDSVTLERTKQMVVDKMTSRDTLSRLEGYLEKTFDVENRLSERMAALPPDEFEVVLRTAFEEDEWILIAVGAVLGALVGAGQMFYMMSV